MGFVLLLVLVVIAGVAATVWLIFKKVPQDRSVGDASGDRRARTHPWRHGWSGWPDDGP
jgi:hypothetical protein